MKKNKNGDIGKAPLPTTTWHGNNGASLEPLGADDINSIMKIVKDFEKGGKEIEKYPKI